MLAGVPLMLGSLAGLAISLIALATFNLSDSRGRENAPR